MLLALVLIGATVLLARAAWVQIVQRNHWTEIATADLERKTWFPAPRGRILDCKGRVLAEDVPTFDVCVDFRAIDLEPDPQWLYSQAYRRARASGEWPELSKSARRELIEQMKQQVRGDLETMWQMFADLSGRGRMEIEAIRRDVLEKVAARREHIWRLRFEKARDEYESSKPDPWYVRWIVGSKTPPKPEDFREPIGDEISPHVILSGVSSAVYNELKRYEPRLPGILLRPTTHRGYPYGEVAAHVIGHLGPVSREDIEADPNPNDDRLRYRADDLIGRSGVEKLAESTLRGLRGVLVRDRSRRVIGVEEATVGRDVSLTIDIEFQRDIERAFDHVNFMNPDKSIQTLSMTGAAVVLDVRTNRVLAMASVPGFDLNRFDELYPQLVEDTIGRRLMNRALQDALVPGSTAKTIVGIGAISAGVIGVDDRIECTGYPVFDGKRFSMPRCWTMSMRGVSHHKIPWNAPHPTGHLNFAESLERSCNIYFETVGDRLGYGTLGFWFRQFGLGRVSGVGLDEVAGIVPGARGDMPRERSATWYASIGQGTVEATPIQMAGVAATIARDGVWMRPTLVNGITPDVRDEFGKPIPDRIQLNVSPAAMAAAKRGMIAVANSAGGTGDQMHRDDILVAAKTGSATATPIRVVRRDNAGRPVLDAEGNTQCETLPYGTRARPNPLAPWYRASNEAATVGTHGWAIGFVPADNPKIAFAVLVHYGGSGNIAAGSVVQQIIDAAISHGYLTTTSPAGPRALPQTGFDADTSTD